MSEPREILVAVDVVLVLVGAAAGLGGSVVVETYRGRREQRRWLLEQRFDLYVRALVQVDHLLTWARTEVFASADTEGPASQDFSALNAAMALVASDGVKSVWGQLYSTFRQFYPAHKLAVHATRAAHDAGRADSDSVEVIHHRAKLDELLRESRRLEMALAKAMEKDTGRQRG